MKRSIWQKNSKQKFIVATLVVAMFPFSVAWGQDEETASVDDDEMVRAEGKMSVRFGGQINRAALYAKSEGRKSELYFVDNDVASTRLRILALRSIQKGLRVGGAMEIQIESNSSNDDNLNWGQDGASETSGDVNFTERRLEVWLTSKKFGRLYLGQGSVASDGSSEADLSGLSPILVSRMNTNAGGLSFGTPANGSAAGNSNDVKDYFKNYDGLGTGRDDRIRYDTPRWKGLKLQTSYAQGGGTDVALWWSRKLGGNDALRNTRIATRIGYANDRTGDRQRRLSGSASILLNNGLNFTFAAARNRNYDSMDCDSLDDGDNSRTDPQTQNAVRCSLRAGSTQMREVGTTNNEVAGGGRLGPQTSEFYYAKIGYRANLFDWGQTRVGMDFGRVKNPENTGNLLASTRDLNAKATGWGIGVVQKINNTGTDIFFGYRRYSLKRSAPSIIEPGTNAGNFILGPATKAEDISAFMIGMRVKF